MPLTKPLDLAIGAGLGWLSYRFLRSAFTPDDTQALLSGLFEARQHLLGRLAGADLADASNPAGNGPLVSKKADIIPIDDRVKVIAQLIKEGHEHPYLVEMTRKVLSKKSGGQWVVPEKDWKAETVALFNFVRQNVRYTRDPIFRDTYFAGERTLAQGGGDCDDYCVLLGSMLMASGQRVKLRVIQTDDAPTWCHIYLLTSPDGNGEEWIPLDASVAKPAGWEVPGAEEVARTGKPAGYVKRIRDYLVN